jgi:hypothetical protein
VGRLGILPSDLAGLSCLLGLWLGQN